MSSRLDRIRQVPATGSDTLKQTSTRVLIELLDVTLRYPVLR
jgi:hypothetical protein